MSRRNSENGPSGRTRVFNLTLAIIFCALVLFSAVSVIRRITMRKPVSDIPERNNVLTAEFELKDADDAADGVNEEEIIAGKVSGSIVFVTDGTNRSIGAVISKDGYIVTDIGSAVSVEDMNGKTYTVRKFDADLPEGLYLIRIETDSAGAMKLSERNPEDAEKVYVFSPVGNGFIVNSCTAGTDGDYLIMDSALPDGISVIVDADGNLLDIGLPENSGSEVKVKNNLSKLQLFAAAAENRE